MSSDILNFSADSIEDKEAVIEFNSELLSQEDLVKFTNKISDKFSGILVNQIIIKMPESKKFIFFFSISTFTSLGGSDRFYR